MNKTDTLLRVVGSPFCEMETFDHQISESYAHDLYSYAVKNKVGLLYLLSLKKRKMLDHLGMQGLWNNEISKHQQQRITAANISSQLNHLGSDYALFKSVFHFPATPNDVDILVFNSEDGYQKILDYLPTVGYRKIEETPSPSEVMFHDLRECDHLDMQSKDIFHIDLYREAGASHVIYLDKMKLRRYVTTEMIEGTEVRVFTPEAELVAIIAHAILPEQITTLLVYYASLCYLKGPFDLDGFLQIAQENQVVFPLRIHFTITASLHQTAHGFVPEPIEYILGQIGRLGPEERLLKSSGFTMPYRCSTASALKTIAFKLREGTFRKSMRRQVASMARNPKLTKWVVKNLVWRRTRDTY